MKRWMKWTCASVLAGLLIIVADYAVYPLLVGIGGQSHDRGQNGIWLQDTWYRGGQKESVQSLAKRLQRDGFRDAFFHVRFITKKGVLRYQHPENARRLNSQMQQLAPGIRSIAWVYIGNERGITGVNLEDVAVRHKIAAQMRELTTTYGFDGVQIDYEICPDNDDAFLRLLEETRAALPPGKQLGVATAMWFPVTVSGFTWSKAYFGKVAALSDQLVVMAYDSAMKLPRSYVWAIKQQAIQLPPVVAAANPQCEFLLGLPTYEDPTPSHDPRAENLRLALKGVREAYTTAPSNFTGIAIFADYSTDATEWEQYNRLWHQTKQNPQ